MRDWKDDQPFTIPFNFRRVKAARKSHKCSTCGREIPAGTPYNRTTWLEIDGKREVQTIREHPNACWMYK